MWALVSRRTERESAPCRECRTPGEAPSGHDSIRCAHRTRHAISAHAGDDPLAMPERPNLSRNGAGERRHLRTRSGGCRGGSGRKPTPFVASDRDAGVRKMILACVVRLCLALEPFARDSFSGESGSTTSTPASGLGAHTRRPGAGPPYLRRAMPCRSRPSAPERSCPWPVRA